MFVKKLEKLPADMRKVLKICSRQAAALDYRIYLIGGIVRDIILRRPNYDLDVVVEGEGIRFARALADFFGTEMRKHHAFGTATVYHKKFKIDIATARSESYDHWGALPGVKPALLEHDLYRRDFTINALAVSLNRRDYGSLIDFYHGYQDLRKKKVRVLHGKSFLDDPTRIFRAVRFEQRFDFSIEPYTLGLLRQAIKAGALSLVNEHRLRDEMILIFRESDPLSCLRRINNLMGFSFISPHLKLNTNDLSLLRRIHLSLHWYAARFPGQPPLVDWSVYFLGLINRLPQRAREVFSSRYGFNKRERLLFQNFRADRERIRRLEAKEISLSALYELLSPMTAEELIFFRADFPNRRIRRRIEYYLEKLRHIRLKVQGRDLERLKVSPQSVYGRILRELLHLKIDKKLSSKREEMRELRGILEKMGCGYTRFKV